MKGVHAKDTEGTCDCSLRLASALAAFYPLAALMAFFALCFRDPSLLPNTATEMFELRYPCAMVSEPESWTRLI